MVNAEWIFKLDGNRLFVSSKSIFKNATIDHPLLSQATFNVVRAVLLTNLVFCDLTS